MIAIQVLERPIRRGLANRLGSVIIETKSRPSRLGTYEPGWEALGAPRRFPTAEFERTDAKPESTHYSRDA
jgi:hypothetical protein